MSTTIEPALVSKRDAADYLGGSSLRHISRLIHAGKIVAVKDGVRTKVDFPSLKAYFGSLPIKEDCAPLACSRAWKVRP
jgi:hypothetical protein